MVDSCDTREASNTVQVLTPVTVTKFAHHQRHKGWRDIELTNETAEVTAFSIHFAALSRDPQDDDDIIMDEFCMLERFEKGNFRDYLLINTSGHAGSTRTGMTPRTWQCSDTRLQHQEADQHEDPAGGVQE